MGMITPSYEKLQLELSDLIKQFTPVINSSCWKITAHPTEELRQQAILEFCQLTQECRDLKYLGAYASDYLPLRLQGYARSCVYQVRLTAHAIKKFKTEQSTEVARWIEGKAVTDDVVTSDYGSPDEYAEQQDMQALVAQAIASLPENYRSVITRLFFEGCSAPDVAEQDGVSVQAIYKIRKAALERLRQYPGLSDLLPELSVTESEPSVEVVHEMAEPTVIKPEPVSFFKSVLRLSKESLLYLVKSLEQPSMHLPFSEVRQYINRDVTNRDRLIDRGLLAASAVLGVAATVWTPYLCFAAMASYFALSVRQFARSYRKLSARYRLWAAIATMIFVSVTAAFPVNAQIQFSFILQSTQAMLDSCLFNQITGLIVLSFIIFGAFRGWVMFTLAVEAFEWVQAKKHQQSGSENMKTIAQGAAAIIFVGVIEPLIVSSCGAAAG